MSWRVRLPLLALAGLVLLAASTFLTRRHATARAKVDVSPAKPPRRVRAEGVLMPAPGAEVTLRSEMAGTLTFLVPEAAVVHKGQALARLRSDEEHAALAVARARLDEYRAHARYAEAELRRSRTLVKQAAIAASVLDAAIREHDVDEARVAAQASEVKRLAAVARKTELVAPIDGVVVGRAAEAGERVESGSELVTIADLARTRIEAEVAEADMGDIAAGCAAMVTAEGHPGEEWRGTVVEIPSRVVPSRLRPQDPSRPSDTGVVVLKIALAAPAALRLRERVEVAIEPATHPITQRSAP